MALTKKTKNGGYVAATDLVEVVKSASVQAHFAWLGVSKPSISECTAC